VQEIEFSIAVIFGKLFVVGVIGFCKILEALRNQIGNPKFVPLYFEF
jgi:hypothetical protein